ncbi:MAG: hypothetical protein ACLTUE_03730 [Oscillospiraceae bacterium]
MGHEDEELQAYYRMMTALRGSSEALRRGGLRVLAAGNGRIAFPARLEASASSCA